MVSYLLTGYFIAVNLLGFAAMGVDKRRAIRKRWRIPEARLLLFAAVGGSVGSLLGMYVFHHKTRKPKFFLGIPAIFMVQVLIAIWIFAKR